MFKGNSAGLFHIQLYLKKFVGSFFISIFGFSQIIHSIRSIVGFPIGIPLHGIARNCYRIAWNLQDSQ